VRTAAKQQGRRLGRGPAEARRVAEGLAIAVGAEAAGVAHFDATVRRADGAAGAADFEQTVRGADGAAVQLGELVGLEGRHQLGLGIFINKFERYGNVDSPKSDSSTTIKTPAPYAQNLGPMPAKESAAF
jgi:hypothetical protein